MTRFAMTPHLLLGRECVGCVGVLNDTKTTPLLDGHMHIAQRLFTVSARTQFTDVQCKVTTTFQRWNLVTVRKHKVRRDRLRRQIVSILENHTLSTFLVAQQHVFMITGRRLQLWSIIIYLII